MGAVDLRLQCRLDHTLGEQRPLCADLPVLVVLLDRADQPDVRIVVEGLEVWTPLRRALVPGPGINARAGQRHVDRPELSHERLVGAPEVRLERAVRQVLHLGAQDRTGGIANRNQAFDDARVLLEDAVLLLAFLDLHRHRLAVDDLMQGPLLDQVAAFLEARPLPCRADIRTSAFPQRLDVERLRHRKACQSSQTEECARQGVVEHQHRVRGAGVFRPELSARPAVPTQHLLTVLRKIAVDAERSLPLVCVGQVSDLKPGGPARAVPDLATAQDQHVHDHVRSGIIAHSTCRQANRTDQIGRFEQVPACCGVALVHRPARRYEQTHRSRPQAGHCACNEVVMQRQAKPPQLVRAAHRAVAERRVANRKVELLGNLRRREVLRAHPLVRKQLAGDAGGQRVVLDRRPGRLRGKFLRDRAHEQTRATARLQRTSAAEPHLRHQIPQRMHDQFRRVMGVLRGPRQSGPLLLARQRLKLHPNLFPALTEGFARTGEQAVGQLPGSKSRKLRQQSLLGRRCIAALRFQFGQKADSGEVVPRPRFPALCQVACAAETKIDLRRHDRGCSGFFREGRGLVERTISGQVAPEQGITAATQGGGVEKAELGLTHGRNSGQAAAPGLRGDRPGGRKTNRMGLGERRSGLPDQVTADRSAERSVRAHCGTDATGPHGDRGIPDGPGARPATRHSDPSRSRRAAGCQRAPGRSLREWSSPRGGPEPG
ncbi:hypothetical protein A0123_03226 [Gluconobacter cerinus]|uniref:Uncharacterized protein n=1 Tax=Gluconobacter cerinus TaxID=38307 RepID=A0A1B6VFU5_9PROT|nr:hypothetical protein A0123_03226 [Gluconobacter cerinus]